MASSLSLTHIAPRCSAAKDARCRFFGGSLAVLFLSATVMLTTGCMTYSPEKNMALFARHAPVPQLVPSGKQFASAEALAAREAGSFALVGSGASMEPMYARGTAIVVHERHFQTLKAGMPVVYRNSRGFYVAHVLLENIRGGWLVIGLNSREPDDDLVTPANFVGVITAAFSPADAAVRVDVASRVARQDGSDRSARQAVLPDGKLSRQLAVDHNFLQ